MLVECKRPQERNAIRSNVKSAASQVRDKLAKAINACGVVAISVTHALNAGRKLSVVPDGEKIGQQFLEDHVEQLCQQEATVWSRRWFPAQVLAVIFHASVAAVFGDQLVRAKATIIKPLVSNEPFSIFATELRRLYPAENLFL